MLTEEEADDLIYCSRAGELEEMRSTIVSTLQKHDNGNSKSIAYNQLMKEVAESNPAKNTLLHFAAANGHLGAYG